MTLDDWSRLSIRVIRFLTN